MTVLTTNAQAGPYTGNGMTTAFAFAFKAMTAAEVAVYANGAPVAASLYSVTLTGSGGMVTFAAAPASGVSILILSAPSFLQEIDLENDAVVLAQAFDEAHDRAAVRDIRLNALLSLVSNPALLAASRAGKYLSWDGGGNPVASSGTTGPIPSPLDFGVVGDQAIDDTAAWQDYFDHCLANKLPIAPQIPIISKISDTLTIDSSGRMQEVFTGLGYAVPVDLRAVMFVYQGTRNRIVFSMGGAPYYQHAEIRLPAVVAGGTIQWPKSVQELLCTPGTHIDTAIRLRNMTFVRIHENLVYGFSKGIEHVGTRYCTIYGGDLSDCRFARVWTTEGSDHDASFSNENLILGGRIGCSTTSALLGDAFGDVMTWDKAASYRGQDANRFIGQVYELGQPASATYRVPVRMDGAGSNNSWIETRHEGNKGPFAICDGRGKTSNGATPNSTGLVQASNNRFQIIYDIAGVDQREYALQVNGASGNIYSGPHSAEHKWHSGDLRRLVSSNGGANAPYIGGDMFFMDTGTPVRALTWAGQVATARDSVHLLSCGLFVAVDTSAIKTIRVALAARAGFEGRVYICAHDAAGARLIDNFVGDPWGDEPYVKGAQLNAHVAYGGGYTVGGDNMSSDYIFTVREEVKKVYVGYSAGTLVAAQAIALAGYTTSETISDALSITGMRVFADVDDPGLQLIATANPGTAGTHGYYAKGCIVGNANAAAGQPAGWQCSTAGWLAAAWAAATEYKIVGTIRTNNSGKMYELITAGTSAGSGGPTGTGADITDGTEPGACHWKYIGIKAAFVALANTV